MGQTEKICKGTAIGDSRSDLPLFATVGLSVAFNATATAKLAATEALDGDDLRLTLPLLERLPRINLS
jgi:phosphoserine phosphatase